MNFPVSVAFGHSEFVNRPQLLAFFELAAHEFQGWTLRKGSDSESRN
jgi:hypothetical protein